LRAPPRPYTAAASAEQRPAPVAPVPSPVPSPAIAGRPGEASSASEQVPAVRSAAAAVESTIGGLSVAVEDAERAAEIRRGLFRVLEWLTGRLQRDLGAQPFDAGRLREDAVHIGDLSQMVGDAFATDTRGLRENGAALPGIWEHRADFDALAGRLTAAAADVATAARAGERGLAAPAIARLQQACEACHERYRASLGAVPR
jgi:cytochrome c556